MAVTTGTLTLTQQWISFNQFMLKAVIQSTGDGTGGGVYVSKDLADYIPANCDVEVMDCYVHNNDAATAEMSLGLTSTEWTMSFGSLLGFNANALRNINIDAAGAQNFALGKEAALVRMPLYLGNPTGTTKYLHLACKTNVNTKTYYGMARLKVTLTR